MVVRMIAPPASGSSQYAVGVDGWVLRSLSHRQLEVSSTDSNAQTVVVLATASGPTELTAMAVSVCVEAFHECGPAGGSVVDRLRAARAGLRRDAEFFDRVQVHLSGVILAGDRAVIGVTGALPIYLLSDRYAARVDPLVARPRGVMAADIDARMVGEVRLARGQQLLLGTTAFEDLGLPLHWPEDADTGEAAWLARRADDMTAVSNAGFVLMTVAASGPVHG